MRGPRNHWEIAHAWVAFNQGARYFAIKGEQVRAPEAAKGSRMYYETNRIWSYGSHFMIAKFIDTGTVLFTPRGYSSSTGKHKGYVRGAISGLPRIFLADPMNDHRHNAKIYACEVQDAWGEALRARKHREAKILHALGRYEEMVEYCQCFGVPTPTPELTTPKGDIETFEHRLTQIGIELGITIPVPWRASE